MATQMYRDSEGIFHDQERSRSGSVEPKQFAWSDAARAAAIEARKKHQTGDTVEHKGGNYKVLAVHPTSGALQISKPQGGAKNLDHSEISPSDAKILRKGVAEHQLSKSDTEVVPMKGGPAGGMSVQTKSGTHLGSIRPSSKTVKLTGMKIPGSTTYEARNAFTTNTSTHPTIEAAHQAILAAHNGK